MSLFYNHISLYLFIFCIFSTFFLLLFVLKFFFRPPIYLIITVYAESLCNPNTVQGAFAM